MEQILNLVVLILLSVINDMMNKSFEAKENNNGK